MKLRFQQETIQLNPPIQIDEIIEQTNCLLGDTYYFSHFIIDGEEVKEDSERYVHQHIHSIEEIEIVAIEAKVFINDLMLSAEEYIKRATPLIEMLADRFYEQPKEQDWLDLNDLFGGLQWLHSMLQVVDESPARPNNWAALQEVVEPLAEVLGDFEEALENNDTILIGDLLSYEVKPVFEALQPLITSMIDTTGERYDIH